ncbi:MAG: Crp/Fnr family transcriptional regulator [Actinophytocola sp.]|uniref:Crp/Fnr family transcriptional regulator n=1 Tax=Actinophytocola sp. TaxID=1872138 RepID=UPI003C75A621
MTAEEPVPASFLSYLDPDDREFLRARGTPRKLPAHTVLMHEGDPTNHVLVLLSGWVRVFRTTPDGQVVLLALRGPGDVIGDIAALMDFPRTATVDSMQETGFTQFRHDEFLACVHERPSVGFALLRQMAVRLRDADAARVDFATMDVAQRVAALLVYLADVHGTMTERGVAVRMPLTQQDIANRVGGSLRAVTRAVAAFRERGILITGRREFVITAPGVLRSFSPNMPNDT